MTDLSTSPVSFVVDVRRLPEKGFPVAIEADERQRAGLAQAHGLVSVERFDAQLTVSAWKRDGVAVRGRVRAAIVQSCVVTLEPVPAEIDEPVEALFLPPDSPLARPSYQDGELFLSAEGTDAPDVLEGHSIDVGAIAEEFFGLAIDPYPRSSGAAAAMQDDTVNPASPFAGLADRLRKH